VKHQKPRRPGGQIRVRSKSLEHIDETKLSLAVWLIAKRLVEEQIELDADSVDTDSKPPGVLS